MQVYIQVDGKKSNLVKVSNKIIVSFWGTSDNDAYLQAYEHATQKGWQLVDPNTKAPLEVVNDDNKI